YLVMCTYEYLRLCMFIYAAYSLFAFHHPPSTRMYPLSLHDALPISRRCVEACVYGTLDFVGYPRFPAPVEFIAAVIAYYVHPVNIQTACLIMEGAEFTENIINGFERPVKASELFAFTLRVRAGNTDVLTDAEENVRQKLRAEGVM